jgi:hypothetical protein
LKTAQIYLDCSNPTDVLPDDELLETALLNSAIDEALAISIWDTICDGSTKQRLESLAIYSGGGSAFSNCHPSDLITLVCHFSRSYRIIRTSKAKYGDVTVVELTKEMRENVDERQREREQFMFEKWGHKGDAGPAFKAFNRLFPYKETGKDWREVWRSWPLQRSK